MHSRILSKLTAATRSKSNLIINRRMDRARHAADVLIPCGIGSGVVGGAILGGACAGMAALDDAKLAPLPKRILFATGAVGGGTLFGAYSGLFAGVGLGFFGTLAVAAPEAVALGGAAYIYKNKS